MRLAAILAMLLLCTSCDRPAIEPGQSLVGAKELPPAKALSHETIEINRASRSSTSGRLTYELRPDDSLIVTLASQDWKTPIGHEIFQLQPEIAEQARRALWRVRPEELKGVEWINPPPDCPPPPTDTHPEIAVAFIAEGPKPGVADDRVGIFDLPYKSICDTRQSNEARALIQGVLRSFPASKVATEFEQRRDIILVPS
ncbi:MAG: hypothetical protein ACJ8FS_02345 [Sphingomicrobium sp.]